MCDIGREVTPLLICAFELARHPVEALDQLAKLWRVVIWHAHDSPKLYRDVVVQVADDPDFIDGVRTLYNNDYDNSSGLGIGNDKEYFENNEGRLIDGKGVIRYQHIGPIAPQEIATILRELEQAK